MRDLAQFFSFMNDIDFRYVVLRNWEHLPYRAETGEHSDLDLLVYDLAHFLEVFPGLERVHPVPRVQFKLAVRDSYTFLDARSVGDGYYPEQFQLNILNTREWNSAGFWMPNPLHHRLALAYHAVHHKGQNKYQNYLGPVSVAKLAGALKESEIGWVEPDDPTVGRYNAYLKGATSAVSKGDGYVEKRQTAFTDYNLIDNEERILDRLDNPHFPKILASTNGTLRIEDCGEPMNCGNLPPDWRAQLIAICDHLQDAKVVHRDVRPENLMIKDNIIKLIDFGWARMASEPDGKFPDLLGYPYKCPSGFNDRYSMKRVIKYLEAECESLP